MLHMIIYYARAFILCCVQLYKELTIYKYIPYI